MKEQKSWFIPVLPILCVGVVIVWLAMHRTSPRKISPKEAVATLRIITVKDISLAPVEYGYGVAEPARVWEAVSQVKGEIVSLHKNLHSGELLPKGAELLRIDSTDYHLIEEQLESGVRRIEAELSGLEKEEANARSAILLEKESLKLAEQSLARLVRLRKTRAVSDDEVDRDERTVIDQKKRILAIEKTLSLIPSRADFLKAERANNKGKLAHARRDIERTVIRAPFDCRLGTVNLEHSQVVQAGQHLFEAHGTDAVEVEALFRPEQLRNLLPQSLRKEIENEITMDTLKKLFNFTVTVHLTSGSFKASWPARFERLREKVDPGTRAIHVVAVVDAPYEKAIPGVRPALVRGMSCKMELKAPARPHVTVIPACALEGSLVYVLSDKNRLQKRKVVPDFFFQDLVIIKDGLVAGERLVVSDPSFAIEGMMVNPVVDHGLEAYIQRLSVPVKEEQK